MRCQACGQTSAEHELIEIENGRPQVMHFCSNCLPDRVRSVAAPMRVAFTAIEKQADDLHIWLLVTPATAQSQAVLRISSDIDIQFPAEDGQVFRYAEKAQQFRPDCPGDLFVHISVREDEIEEQPEFEL